MTKIYGVWFINHNAMRLLARFKHRGTLTPVEKLVGPIVVLIFGVVISDSKSAVPRILVDSLQSGH